MRIKNHRNVLIFRHPNTVLMPKRIKIRRLLSLPPMTTKLNIQQVYIINLILGFGISLKLIVIITLDPLHVDQNPGQHVIGTANNPNPYYSRP